MVRSAQAGLAVLAGVMALGVSGLTLMETDRGWNDAVWQDSSAARTLAGVASLVCIVGAVLTADAVLRDAERDRGQRLRLGLLVEGVAVAVWLLAVLLAPS